jgi:DNA-binding CsgD family transcriptional regulator
MNRNLPLLARLTASLSLFGIFLCIHISFTLAHFLPPESNGVMDTVYAFFFAGAALGAALCPLFLPVPGGKNKPLPMGICFIAFLTAGEFISRSLGVQVWLNSTVARGVMSVNEGMITTMCYGLFYLAWLRPHEAAPSGVKARTGGVCSLVLGAALLGSVLARYYSVPLLEADIAAREPAVQEPLKAVEFVFNVIKWCMAAVGVCAGLSVLTAPNAAGEGESAARATAADWPLILRLIGLASVFTMLNGVLDMRMFPLYSEKAAYYPHYVTVAAAVPVLGFLAGRSIGRFLRWFLPPAIVLFILVSCLPLFEDHPRFNMIMSTLIAVVHYTIWVVFTAAVVEHYAHGFWFYGMAALIFFSAVFAFLAPVINPLVPDGTEYRVLFIVIAAVLFMLLAFRLIFPKPRRLRRRMPRKTLSAFDDIFRERGLSGREIEVARLLVKEGFGSKEIGKRLYITPGTAKVHISKIYQKFGVNNRAEFMSLFMKVRG